VFKQSHTTHPDRKPRASVLWISLGAADIEEAAEANGIAKRTLYRAKAKLGIRAVVRSKRINGHGDGTYRLKQGKSAIDEGSGFDMLRVVATPSNPRLTARKPR
jgi:hypothetical protein